MNFEGSLLNCARAGIFIKFTRMRSIRLITISTDPNGDYSVSPNYTEEAVSAVSPAFSTGVRASRTRDAANLANGVHSLDAEEPGALAEALTMDFQSLRRRLAAGNTDFDDEKAGLRSGALRSGNNRPARVTM